MVKQLKVRFANRKDLNWLSKKDDIEKNIIKRKIEQKEIIVAESQNKLIGFLRIEFFWTKIPYIEMIRVDKKYRGQGVGKSILKSLEKYLIKKRYKILFSSSQANEPEPQKWHKKLGFTKCGYIDKISPTREIFFSKKLRRVAE